MEHIGSEIKIEECVAKSPRVAEQCDVNINSTQDRRVLQKLVQWLSVSALRFHTTGPRFKPEARQGQLSLSSKSTTRAIPKHTSDRPSGWNIYSCISEAKVMKNEMDTIGLGPHGRLHR
ncbi:hypothetical protein TNCV_3923171 [Trichonephila clavipes]|nr:hypothetical protein TNCV_3923171 [Trichonephila clavipes]